MSVVQEMVFKEDMNVIFKKFGITSEIDYRNKVILGPMVSVSTLPMRLISLMYGADIVYGEELIDHLVLKTFRTFDEDTGIVRFKQSKKDTRHSLVFSSFKNEPVIFQLGTSDAIRALKAAEIVANDVKGIDINMGCPFRFSVSGGMGAALLKTPELASDIIKTLKRNLNLPVSCKIRIFEDEKKSIELVKILESAGANAITIRPHFVSDRRRFPSRTPMVKIISDAVSIPTIYNGDVFEQKHIELSKKISNCDSVMISRAAQWNPSIFDPKGFTPLNNVTREYIEIASRLGGSFRDAKFCLLGMMKGRFSGTETFRNLAKSKVWEELENALDIFDKESAEDFGAEYDPRKCNRDVFSSFWYSDKNDIESNKKFKS